MELHFAHPPLQRIAESALRSDAHFGRRDAALFRQRICELGAADNLAIAKSIPTLRLQRLALRGGRFTVQLRMGLRLVFETMEPECAMGSDGDVDLAKVVAVRVVAVEECDDL
jgi:hypothetical protein